MNFTIPATSKRIITIVVSTIAICAVVTITTLSTCVILNVKPDATLLTAYVGITTGALGALTGLLANTRSTPGTDADMPKVTTSTTTSTETATTAVPSADKPTV